MLQQRRGGAWPGQIKFHDLACEMAAATSWLTLMAVGWLLPYFHQQLLHFPVRPEACVAPGLC
jgi:hypothetical protein